MNTQPRPDFESLSRMDLIHLCNEKLVFAARDLAWFTPHGITANDIVILAHKCDDYDKALNQPEGVFDFGYFNKMQKELLAFVVDLCKLGLRIWSTDPSRAKDYQLPGMPLFGGEHNQSNVA